MKHPNHERLLWLLQNDMPPEEEAGLRQEVAHSPSLRAELEEMQRLQNLLQTTVTTSSKHALRPFFTDRVMRRLVRTETATTRPEEELFSSLLRLFRPVALAGLVMILGLITYNMTRSDIYDAQPSPTEAMLGLHPSTLATAYNLDLETIPSIDP